MRRKQRRQTCGTSADDNYTGSRKVHSQPALAWRKMAHDSYMFYGGGGPGEYSGRRALALKGACRVTFEEITIGDT